MSPFSRRAAVTVGLLAVALTAQATDVYFTLRNPSGPYKLMKTDENYSSPTFVGNTSFTSQFGTMAWDTSTSTMFTTTVDAVHGSSPGQLVKVDLSTGSTTTVGSTTNGMYALAFDGSGTLWGAHDAGVTGGLAKLWKIDKTTGTSSEVATTTFGGTEVRLNSLTYDTLRNRMIATDARSIYQIDLTSGALTKLVNSVFSDTSSIGYDAVHDQFLAIDNNITFYRFSSDFATKTTWSMANRGGRIGVISTVPEPATVAALGVGIAALLRRRRK